MGTQVSARDEVASLRVTRAGKAHKRAMPIARLVSNGMDFADAIELHALVDQGLEWADAAGRLADRNLAHARRALRRGHRQSARSWYLLASACFRFGQARLADDDPLKRGAATGSMLDAFRRGGELSDPPIERVEVPWRDGRLTGWLLRSGRATPHPFVVQLCGIGGSREEYETGSRYLIERGVSALLVDAPGQGETRLCERLHPSTSTSRTPSVPSSISRWPIVTATVAKGLGATAPGDGSPPWLQPMTLGSPGLHERRNRSPHRDPRTIPALRPRDAADDRS